MTERAFEQGALLASRYRVLRDRPNSASGLHLVDARDELSAGAGLVRLALISAASAPSLESAVRRAWRYAVGVRGLGELLGVSEIEPGLQAVVYSTPDGSTLDEMQGALEPARAAGILAEVRNILEPLHEQGMSHGYLAPELILVTTSGDVRLLGFGLGQAAEGTSSRGQSPPLDIAAITALSSELGSARAEVAAPEVELAPAAPEPEVAVAPPPAPVPAPAPTPALKPTPAPFDPRIFDPAPPVAPRRSWVAFVAIGLGVLAMVGGVAAAFVVVRRSGPVASASTSALPVPAAPALPPPPLATPDPQPEIDSEDAGASPNAGSPPSVKLSPPIQVKPPPGHRTAALPVDEKVPTWGPWDAPVTLTLFADLQCPHTRALLPELVRLKAELGNDLRWVFRHRPLTQHPDAEPVARLLAAVGEELGGSAFWKLVTELAKDPEGDANQIIETWFERAGVDGATRASIETSQAARAAVERDLELGGRLMVRSTPALFVNGTRLDGFQPESELLQVLRKERRAALFTLLSGVDPATVYVARTLRNFINLGDDPSERACLPSQNAPGRGPEEAPVTIVQYCAFESNYCQQAEPALSALVARHPREVRVAWKSFPISDNAEGRLAANFALAARRAGGDPAFWAVHRALLDAKAALEAPALLAQVKKLGLDVDALLAAARAGAHDESITADVTLGRKLGVTGVPTYFVNGVRHDGLLSLAELEALLREELVVAKRVSALGRGPVDDLVCSALGR